MSATDGARAGPEATPARQVEHQQRAPATGEEIGAGSAGSLVDTLGPGVLAMAAASAADGSGGLLSRTDRATRSRLMLAMQGSLGNAAVQRAIAGAGTRPLRRLRGPVSTTIQRQPPASQAELDEVTRLMPIMPALNTLISAVNSECGLWRTWRGSMVGPVPGAGAYAAMDQFKTAIRSQGFDVNDEGIQKMAQRRVTGDNRQLLTEMCSFALGTSTRSAGDFTGLARLCGVQTRRLDHKYTLNIGYSVQVALKLAVGVGYTFRSGSIVYTNAFGMTYTKPLAMHSGGGSYGPGAKAKVKNPLGRKSGTVGFQGSGSDESAIFWMPDDFETSFSVTKVAAGAALGVKKEVKFIEVVRVTSDKHPPLLFDLLGGNAVATDEGVEFAAEIGGGVEIEWGKMTGDAATVSAPALEQARENAEKAGLTTPDPQNPSWEVIGATVVQFATGKSLPDAAGAALLNKFATYVAKWLRDNPGADIRFEIIGQASPRWRHPKKGEVPIDRNQKLSEDRAAWTKVYLQNAWDATGEAECQISATACAGPELEMDDDRARASGAGSHQGLAETRDPDNDDAGYRVASITAWGKKAPPPPPANPPATLTQ